MTSSLVEAEMEEQYSEDEENKLVLPCVASQLEDYSPAKEQSPEPKPVERDSPESPSGVKRWEIGPFLQSFKSKMASFTEMVMSPVRLFKPSDSLSSIALHDEQEPFMTESNVDNSAHTEEVETKDDAFRNGLFPKRPSSEKMQCNTAPKRHRVVQRLNFCTISTINHKPVLDHIQMHNDVSPNEENQTNCPSRQSKAVLQNGTHDASPCKAQTLLATFSTDKTLCSSATHVSSQANVQIDAAVQNRLSGESKTHGSDATCVQSHKSGFSDWDSNLLKPESNCSTNKTCLNKPDAEASSFSTSSGFDSTDKDTSTEIHSRMATRKSPRKKLLSGMTLSTSSGLDTFMTGSTDVEIKQLPSECDMECAQHLTEVSNPPMSMSVWEVRAKRCRAAPQTKKDSHTRRNCDLENAKEARPVRNKKFRNKEIKQVDETCVPVRKKRKRVSMMHQDSDEPIGTFNTTVSEIRQSVETSKEIRPGKALRSQLRKNVNCRTSMTISNEGDASDATSLQNVTLSVSIDNPTNDPSEFTGFQHHMQPKGLEKTTEARKTRRQLKSLQLRNLHPPKHKSEDYSVASVVDPAGPSKPSKRTLLYSEQLISAAEEQEASLSGLEAREVKELLSRDSTTALHLERKLSRPKKSVKRPRRKDVAIAKRKGVFVDEDDLKSQEETTEVPPVVSLSGSGANRLLRSFSCPEIPSLVFSERHLPRSHMHGSSSTSPSRRSLPAPVPILLHSPSKRTRRHTVCSGEIAPLCLRKEVYPASRGSPSCPSSPYSPSPSLTALASCFLSSPLAFLSKSSSQGRSHVCDASTGSISAASSFVTSSSSPPPPPSFSSPFTSTLTSCHALTSPSSVVTPSPETPSASVSSLCSAFSQSSLEGDHGVLQMECDRAIGEDERSNFDLKLTAAISEEKALSDSEIKTDIKDGQREKRVSSIRIRKKIPKPQNNLTPMGLPKIIRIKKKDFSLEEIYTNKNFSKPPDGRLETIFEVPLNQRDGSQTVVGKKKMKRFVEFPELGVARKPKKPLVGVVLGGGAQRKAAGNSGICRTRRGVGGSRAEDGLTLQDLESLLCSKLEELDMWMALQQVAG